MRKLKLLAISTLTTIALIMALTLAACGGDPHPGARRTSIRKVDKPGNCFHKPINRNTHTRPTAHQAHQAHQPGTSTPEPVRPTRIRPSRTESPGATNTPAEDATQEPGPEETTQAGSDTGSAVSPLDLIPENPKANDAGPPPGHLRPDRPRPVRAGPQQAHREILEGKSSLKVPQKHA